MGWGLGDQGSTVGHFKVEMAFHLSGGLVKQTLGYVAREQLWLVIGICESVVDIRGRI